MHPLPDPSAKSWISDDGYAMVVNSRGVVEKWTVITQPTEEIKDVKHLQAEMEIDSPDKVELYEEIRRFIRLEILATMTEEQRLLKWHRVPAHCKSDVYIAAAKRKASASEITTQKRRRTEVEAITERMPTHTAHQDQEPTHEELNTGEEDEDEGLDDNNSDKSQPLPEDTESAPALQRPSTSVVKRTKRSEDTRATKSNGQKRTNQSSKNTKSKSSSKKVDKASHAAGSAFVIKIKAR
ncbi:hypothetical protein FRC09_001960 [Ceratobasidium sp. 395]|nr:hypothetical protein FRC09_001960 [Ceratobasidium sp. 395]